ncbi:hypothetical protein AOLI_G00125570 [Acnodon oligacanthus]
MGYRKVYTRQQIKDETGTDLFWICFSITLEKCSGFTSEDSSAFHQDDPLKGRSPSAPLEPSLHRETPTLKDTCASRACASSPNSPRISHLSVSRDDEGEAKWSSWRDPRREKRLSELSRTLRSPPRYWLGINLPPPLLFTTQAREAAKRRTMMEG